MNEFKTTGNILSLCKNYKWPNQELEVKNDFNDDNLNVICIQQ